MSHPLDSFLKKRFLALHCVPAAMAAAGACESLARAYAEIFPLPILVVYDWVRPFYSADKRPLMLAYLLTAAALALGFLFLRGAAARGFGERYKSAVLSSPGLARGYLYALAAWNVSLLGDAFSHWLWAPALAVFAALRARPGLLDDARALLDRWDRASAERAGPRGRAWLLLIAASYASLAWALAPFLKGPPLINEYFDVPEKTWMSSLGAWVDNTSYINRQRLLGMRKVDIASAESPAPLRTPSARELEILASRHGREQMEFLDKNHFELGKQVLSRWVVHHHNHVLAPLMHHDLGLGLKDVHVQYGYLNLVMLRALMRAAGGISYRSYFQVWYGFWLLYIVLLLPAAYALTRDLRYAALAVLIAVAATLRLGYDILFLGPGMNPVRHLFDLPIALCLAFSRGRPAWVAGAYGLALLAVLNNRQFGLLALAAAAGAVPAAAWLSRRAAPVKEAGAAALALAAGVALSRWDALGGDLFSSYFSAGFMGALWGRPQLLSRLTLTLVAAYVPFSLARTASGRAFLPSLFLCLYAQACLVFYIWGGRLEYLLMTAPILALAGVCLLKLSAEAGALPRESLTLSALAAGAVLVFALPALGYFSRTKAIYDRVFQTHQVYSWDFPAARIKSTMDPEPFARALDLIGRYEPGARLYMISQYENILPFLARKVSGMPYFEVASFLYSPRELALCAEKIRRDRPRYLFVDSHIEHDRSGDRVRLHYNPPRPVRRGLIGLLEERLCRLAGAKDWDYYEFATPIIPSESKIRVRRLGYLRDLFRRVRADYEPVERTALITVYRRRAERAP